MKREIKCRGFHKFGGISGWIYGSLLQDGKTYYITQPHASYSVEPKSIGQYTGLKDKDGNEIYEGDIMGEGKVVWDRQFSGFILLGKDWKHNMNYARQNYTVKGNTFENSNILP